MHYTHYLTRKDEKSYMPVILPAPISFKNRIQHMVEVIPRIFRYHKKFYIILVFTGTSAELLWYSYMLLIPTTERIKVWDQDYVLRVFKKRNMYNLVFRFATLGT